MGAPSGSSGQSHHPWGWVAFSAAVVAGIVSSYIFGLLPSFPGGDKGATPSPSSTPSGAGVTGSPVAIPTGSRDVVQNLQLGISPGEISIAAKSYTTIEVSDATPGAFIDVEIDQPDYVDGGVCPKLIKGPCNLVATDGGTANRDGLYSLQFPQDPQMELFEGLYQITVRDRHTGAVVSIDLEVNG